MIVCKYHYIPITHKVTRSGALRAYCMMHKKFLFKEEYREIPDQLWEILKRLNKMDEYLGEIWDIAFHSKKYPKMHKGIPEHGLGEVFVALHQAQRSICSWNNGVLEQRPDDWLQDPKED